MVNAIEIYSINKLDHLPLENLAYYIVFCPRLVIYV